MTYLTVMQSPMYHQMSIEDLLFGSSDNYSEPLLVTKNISNTRTYEFDHINRKFLSKINISDLIVRLQKFNKSVDVLRSVDRHSLYTSFSIPKKSGGLRHIDAPQPRLMSALRDLKVIFEDDFHALYHTNAFAYIKGRSTIDAMKRHQGNNSRWFGKYDLSNFFGSTTLDFVMRQFSMVFPFSEVVKYSEGEEQLRKALELAFLDGGLPQGTPISPLITNIMMIPIDFKLANEFRDHNHQKYIYTRYADDFIVSSRYEFDCREIETVIVNMLREFEAPFTVNEKKTRYGSSSGRNWNLGIMLNKDNEMTVGYRAKKQFKNMLYNYAMDRKNGIYWNKHDLQVMSGYYNYYWMIEKETIDKMVDYIGSETKSDVLKCIHEDLKRMA